MKIYLILLTILCGGMFGCTFARLSNLEEKTGLDIETIMKLETLLFPPKPDF